MSGIALILTGSILYTYLKDKEMQKNNRIKADQAVAMTPSASSSSHRSQPPPEIVFEMADKDEYDLQEADAFLAEEEKRQRRD